MNIDTKDYKIYVHINKINGKMYIGQTKNKVENRWRKNGEGYKPRAGSVSYFWNSIQKYGWDNFEHIILFDNLSLDLANIIEEELIKKYNTTDRNCGYNVKYGGDNHLMPEDMRINLSKITKERMNNYSDEELKMIGKKISKALSGENNGFYGKHHTEETKKKMRDNHANLKGENHPMFNYHHSDSTKKKWSEQRKGKNLYSNNPNAKAVIQYDKNMNLLKIFTSIKEAAESIGVTSQTITGCCKGRLHTAGGYIWKYKNEVQHEQN